MTQVYHNKYSSTYSGNAVQEIDNFQVFVTYNQQNATNYIVNAVQTAANNNGYTLLELTIDYTPGTLYNTYIATIIHLPPGTITPTSSTTSGGISLGNIQSMQIQIIPLLPYIITAIAVIISAFLLYYTMVEVKEIVYGPSGTGFGVGSIAGVVIILGIAYIVSKLA